MYAITVTAIIVMGGKEMSAAVGVGKGVGLGVGGVHMFVCSMVTEKVELVVVALALTMKPVSLSQTK